MQRYHRVRQLWIALAILPAAALPCINDRDTLAFELRNVDALKRVWSEPDRKRRADAVQEIALKAIAGRFERFPPKYYEMRIARLEALPTLSAADYDDLAVAYERLGKNERAISILLDSKTLRTTKADKYRFHANYGTFLVHKWLLKRGEKGSETILDKSIEEIKKAIEINPDSHFGREKVQLALEEQWRNPDSTEYNTSALPELPGDELIVGLSGIAMMGLGYELPDIYWLIAENHVIGQASASLRPELAKRRFEELVSSGHKPVLNLARFQLKNDNAGRTYDELRRDGERVHQERLAYMEMRFARGEHPDTHPAFWSEWIEPPVPVLKRVPSSHASTYYPQMGAMLVAIVALTLIGVLLIWKWVKQRKGLVLH
jgi:tetratricopeptide (TPR) repeat protein